MGFGNISLHLALWDSMARGGAAVTIMFVAALAAEPSCVAVAGTGENSNASTNSSAAQYSSPLAAPVPTDRPWILAPNPAWVALFVGCASLIWNLYNARETKRVARDAQSTARKSAAMAPFRADALAALKELQLATDEIASKARAPQFYQTEFKPLQGRVVDAHRKLNNVLEMMSSDPEVVGSDWCECLGGQYDQYLDCCNTLLNSGTPDDEHRRARVRIKEIANAMQSSVLSRFSNAIGAAWNHGKNKSLATT